MKYKFKEFMSQYFHKPGDCCLQYRWEQFLAMTFQGQNYELAIAYTDKLISQNYIQITQKDIGQCFVITDIGFYELL